MRVIDRSEPTPEVPPAEALGGTGGRLLDPIDRNSEILFGLFMVLTFTGTLSVATAVRQDVRTMLIAAIGCNAAWSHCAGASRWRIGAVMVLLGAVIQAVVIALGG